MTEVSSKKSREERKQLPAQGVALTGTKSPLTFSMVTWRSYCHLNKVHISASSRPKHRARWREKRCSVSVKVPHLLVLPRLSRSVQLDFS